MKDTIPEYSFFLIFLQKQFPTVHIASLRYHSKMYNLIEIIFNIKMSSFDWHEDVGYRTQREI